MLRSKLLNSGKGSAVTLGQEHGFMKSSTFDIWLFPMGGFLAHKIVNSLTCKVSHLIRTAIAIRKNI